MGSRGQVGIAALTERYQRDHQRQDRQDRSGQRHAGQAETVGNHAAADPGAEGIADIEGADVEGGHQVWRGLAEGHHVDLQRRYGGKRGGGPQEQGNFSVSVLTWGTAWAKDNDKDQNENFERLKENRKEIAFRLANANPNWSKTKVDSTGFPEGYSSSQQEVLLYSFLAAYTGKEAANIKLNTMPAIPMLNGRLTYNGLARL